MTISQENNSQQEINKFYNAVIGPKNTDYYLRHFILFDRNNKIGPTWHWPSFFITFYWLLYRKLWLYALMYFLSPFLLTISIVVISIVATKDTANIVGALVGIVGSLIFLFIPPMFANAIYYKHCKKKIVELDNSYDTHIQLADLSTRGGTSKLALLLVIIFNLIIIGYFFKNGYSVYRDRSVYEEVASAVSSARLAQDTIADYYRKTQMLPNNLAEAGFTKKSLSDTTQNMAVYKEDKRYAVAITMGIEPIKNKTLYLIPFLDDKNKMIWKCRSTEIPDKYLPTYCRRNQS